MKLWDCPDTFGNIVYANFGMCKKKKTICYLTKDCVTDMPKLNFWCFTSSNLNEHLIVVSKTAAPVLSL